jgi:hypothetical protein
MRQTCRAQEPYNDGEMLRVDLARVGGQVRGACNGFVLDLADLLSISVWHPDFVRQSVQYKCVERHVRATDQGIESIFARERTM